MRNILLIGAGRSSSSLIRYILEHAREEDWVLTVGDVSVDSALQKINGHQAGKAISLDILNERQRMKAVSDADLVISMLPAHMHISLAEECVNRKKHLLTASYVSKGMQALEESSRSAGVLLLNECGLDPGIDHMSCMEMIEAIKSEGGELVSFKSFTGGLVAPESNDNPWGYKFSWNPRNVILAGQGTARYIENGHYRYLPYSRLFTQAERITIEGHGDFDGYANRDSLAYRKLYGIEHIPTLLRGTLRQHGFCAAWNVFVQLGLTDDSYPVEDSEHLSYANLIEAYLPASAGQGTLRQKVARFMGMDEGDVSLDKVEWTGIFSGQKIGLINATPAQILQQLLESRWKLKEGDKDQVIMQHHFEYKKDSKRFIKTSSLVENGLGNGDTAMARTVGLPLAIAARLVLNGKILLKGVQIPVLKEIYKPVLHELSLLGIRFKEKTKELA